METPRLDALGSSAGEDPNARSMRRFPGDEGLLAAAGTREAIPEGCSRGVIGSSEIWNSEIDRIQAFRSSQAEIVLYLFQQSGGFFRCDAGCPELTGLRNSVRQFRFRLTGARLLWVTPGTVYLIENNDGQIGQFIKEFAFAEDSSQ